MICLSPGIRISRYLGVRISSVLTEAAMWVEVVKGVDKIQERQRKSNNIWTFAKICGTMYV